MARMSIINTEDEQSFIVTRDNSTHDTYKEAQDHLDEISHEKSVGLSKSTLEDLKNIRHSLNLPSNRATIAYIIAKELKALNNGLSNTTL